ncbi:hypothetical protein PG996_011923 [Apiospora saccharicola]|uniref:Uncharacterized protein n=1 Tax=Apiospora saccharicola TaxID=335842 RepID=A0ABR1U165_9PEZI
MPRLSSYQRPSDPLLEDQVYGYNPLFDIFRANDLEALEEYLEKYPPDDETIYGGLSDVFKQAIACGNVDIYHRLVTYQEAQAAAGSDLL